MVFDSMPPLSTNAWIPRHQRKLVAGSGSYSHVRYDPFRDCYWRVVSYPIDSIDSSSMQVRSNFGVILADDQFNIVGEGLIPEGYGWGFMTSEGIACKRWDTDGTEVQDSVTFEVFQFQIEKNQAVDAFREMAIIDAPRKKPGGLAAYINDVHRLNRGDFVVLFVPVEKGCEGCLDYMLDFLETIILKKTSRYIVW